MKPGLPVMKRSRWLDNIGAAIATVILAGCAIWALAFVNRLHGALAHSGEALAAGVFTGEPLSPKRETRTPLWPAYVRNERSNVTFSRLNGVPVMAESWQTHADATDIIAFYRGQMSARGWTDVTEQALGLRSGTRKPGEDNALLQDENYLKHYREIVDSRLVMMRGEWSMTVSAEALPDGRTAARIVAAAAPSMEQFAAELSHSLDGRGETRPLEHVESFGGHRYKTTMIMKNMSPARAFEESMAEFRSQNWHPVNVLGGKLDSGKFGWLVKDGAYGALAVVPAARAAACVTFTEISRE
jgi:hypothetical protein